MNSSPARRWCAGLEPYFERLAEPGSRLVDLEGLERRLMDEAVARAGNNLSAAARMLGLTRAQLAYRLRAAARQGTAEQH